jgi:hypothetical protein
LIDGAARSLVRSAVNGTSLESELSHGPADALLNTMAAQGAFEIGELKIRETLNVFTAEVAHAIVGCAVGAGRAGGGSSAGDGCTAGVVGAVVGNLAAQFLLSSGRQDPATVINFSQMMGGIAGGLVGGDHASASIAATSAGNAVANNECQHTHMCGSDSTRVEIQGNVAAGRLGEVTNPDSLHLSISVSDSYAGITVLDGQPRLGIICTLCLNSRISNEIPSNIVWGPFDLHPPDGLTSTSFANSLIYRADLYSNYWLGYSFPQIPSGNMNSWNFNSGSMISGLLRATTGNVPPFNFSPYQAPGYGNPIPRAMFGR